MIKSIISFLLFSFYMQTFAIVCPIHGQTNIECGTINNLITFGETGVTQTRPQLNGEQIKLTDHFKLHYTFLPPDSTFQQWVDSISIFAESSWARIGRLGYALPPPDGYNGGDSKYDIYIRSQTDKGVAVPESLYAVEPYYYGYTSWIGIIRLPFADDFPHPYSMFERLRALIAHEFHHACQFRYRNITDTDEVWFTENTSVYIEHIIFPEVNTLPYRLLVAMNPLDSPFLQINPYAVGQAPMTYSGGILPVFLHEKYGSSIVRSIWEWMGSATNAQFLPAINEVLKTMTSSTDSLSTAIKAYAIWRYFTGSSRADTIHYFKDGKLYPASLIDSSQDFFPVDTTIGVHGISKTGGTSYIQFQNVSNDSVYLNLNFNGQTNQYWNALIVRHRNGLTPIEDEIQLSSNSQGSKTFVFRSGETIVLIPVLTGWRIGVGSIEYSYSADLYDLLSVRFTNKIHDNNAGGKLILGTIDTLSSGGIRHLPGIEYTVHTANERFSSDSIYKHHDWNKNNTEYSLSHNFYVQMYTREQNADFDGLTSVTIRNELLDGPSVNGGTIEFRDPWYLHSNDSQPDSFFTYNLSTGPFKPVGAYNDTTGGVFLDQDPQQTPTYYTIRAPQTQTIGSYTGCNFLGWSATGQTQVTQPLNTESPVIFKGTNDTVKARYKGHLASSISNATGNNNQRKIMYDGVNAYHMVYESAGDIWYTKSTDGGQTWINEMKISESSPNGDSSKNPSIYSYNDNNNVHVQVVWTQDWSVYFREYTSNNNSWGYISGVSFLQGSPSLLGSIAKPVISKGWIALQYPKDAQGTTKAVAVLKYNQGEWRQSVDMPGVSNQLGRAAIYFDDLNKLHVVCEDTGSIFYNAAQMGNSDPVWTLSSSTNISGGSGRSVNSSPSIAGKGQLVYVVWEGQNSSTEKKEIILRTKNSYNVWSSCTYFGCNSACSSQLNFYEPVISKLSTYQMGLVWRDQTNNIWGSRLDENMSSDWMVYKLDAIALHPTLYNDNSGNAKVLYTQNAGSAPYRLCFTEISSIAPRPAPYFPPNGTNNTGLGVWLGWNCTYGALTYHVQVSTTSGTNFTSGIFVDQAGITSTSYQPGGLTYSTTYYWRVNATIGSWTTDWSDIWSFRTLDYSPPGCPYVFSKIGNDFIIDNNIMPQSEYSANKNKIVTDHYKLLASPTLDNGKYILELREFERERTKLDEVKLLAVDHALNTDIAVLPEGEIVEYIPAYKLKKDEDNDRYENLMILEGKANITTKSDHYVLHFEPTLEEYSSMDNLEGGVLLGGWIVNDGITTSRIIDPKKQSVGIVGNGNKGVVGTSSPFTFRERATLVYVPLERLESEINISFTEKVAFDFASLVVKVSNPTYEVHELNLDEAKHSKLGNITNAINTKDGLTEEIYPGESIKLKFSSPPVEQGRTRSFILVSNGRYERIKEGELLTRIPKEFQLEQNYPNPFNPQTTLRYQLAKSGHVAISVYNQLGQEVAMLVDESKEAGYYETVWDGNNTPSGIYYLRMSVADQFGKQLYLDTKKIVMMK